MLSAPPRLSIVLPNHGHAEELKVSLAAILRQTRPADEIVVVDDGSLDHSLAVIGAFAARSPAMRVIRHETRLGVAAAVNRGIAEATGDYVILASADERVLPTLCEEMLGALALWPDTRLVVARFTEWFPETGELRHGEAGVDDLDLWFLDDAPRFVAPDELRRLFAARPFRLSVNSAMFLRSALIEAGGLDPALGWHSDWFAIHAVAARYGVCAMPRVLSLFRVSPASYSAAGARDRRARMDVARALLAKLDAPEFAELRAFLTDAPAAMSPFVRPLVAALMRQPSRYGFLAATLRWWLREVARGRRPGALARLSRRLATRAGRGSRGGSG